MDKTKWHRLSERDIDSLSGVCSICGPVKLIAQTVASRNYTVYYCANKEKQRRRDKQRRHTVEKYGLTLEEYDDLLCKQEGLCAICRQTCVTGRKLAVDHDHKTGKIRGLLCAWCNQRLGLLENVEWVAKANSYLENT